jgi:hypothetical protein
MATLAATGASGRSVSGDAKARLPHLHHCDTLGAAQGQSTGCAFAVVVSATLDRADGAVLDARLFCGLIVLVCWGRSPNQRRLPHRLGTALAAPGSSPPGSPLRLTSLFWIIVRSM